jgi:predicted acylesterase/phospholipase RssA
MRRSAVHNLMDNGEQEQVVMSISGHKTRSAFERYNIISALSVTPISPKTQSQ